MKKIREILRLYFDCSLSYRQIARSCHVSRISVSEYVRKAQAAGLKSWTEVEGIQDVELERLLQLDSKSMNRRTGKPLPDFTKVQAELRNKHVTLMLLWMEYREQYPLGYEYVQFCNYYRWWQAKQDYCMRQKHKAGEKAFVDYCNGLEITDPVTGEIQKTELFVMVWGASNFTFVEASLSQDLYCWTTSHVHAFEYFGCVPHIVVPDNLKSGVNEPCRYEPDINPTYLSLAEHYQFAVVPARVRMPRDKDQAAYCTSFFTLGGSFSY